ncbi:MAG: PorV/PorQ family protein [Cyclonatronaceae bacterium]
MKRYLSFYLLLLFPCVLVVSPGLAQNQSPGLQFLNIGPNARSLAISEAHTAVLLGAENIFTNPANLVLQDQSNLGLAYTLWLGDSYNTQASFNYKRENDAFGVGILSSVVDDITVRQQPGPALDDFSVRYLALAGSYSRRFGPVAAGITGMYLFEQFFEQNASGFAFSAGVSTEFLDRRLRASAVLLNYGEMNELNITSSEVPAFFKTGLSAQLIQFSAIGTTEIPLLVYVSGDFVVPVDQKRPDPATGNLIQIDPYGAIGINAEVYELVTLRAGYRTGDTARPVSFGASINVKPIEFNYALVPFETGFGTVHSVSLQYNFNL